MANTIKRDSAVSDYDLETCADERMKKSTTLLSEDSGLGSAFLPSPDQEEKMFRDKVVDTKRGDYGIDRLAPMGRMTRSFGIHSGLSEHLADDNTANLSKPCSVSSTDFSTPFERGPVEAMKLKNSSPPQLHPSTQASVSSTHHPLLSTHHLLPSFHPEDTDMGTFTEHQHNKENSQRRSERYERGLKCTDVETAMRILHTHYSFEEINLKRSKTRFATSCYPILANNFIANACWDKVDLETHASKSLREVREEIEKKDKELAELTRLILKRQQDLEEEEQKMIERKKMKMEEEEEEGEAKKAVTFVERDVQAEKVVVQLRQGKSTKNPFRRVMLSVRKKLKRGKAV